MATEKDWTQGDDRLQGPSQPSATRFFADGDASSWCVHKAPGCYGALSVRNRGEGALYVAVGPHLAGSATGAATQHAALLEAGEERTFSFEGGQHAFAMFSTFGADGAAHPIGLVFEMRA